MYFCFMLPTRHELLAQFTSPVLVQHPVYNKGVRTFSCLLEDVLHSSVELPRFQVKIHSLDYLEYTPPADMKAEPLQLRFQQDCFRLWFQVDGNGILQNNSKNTFGSARPGLLGIMERSQRHTYLHQKGVFECFQILFSLLPSSESKCYWNSAIEGKTVLEGNEQRYFENLVFDLLLVVAHKKETSGLSSTARLLEILVVLMKKGLLIIDESQFPKNKPKSLVAKAQAFMEMHYANMHHQRDLAKECGVDINYLNIIFRKNTGKTLYDYLTGIRLEHAKYLLETTDIAVSDVAGQVGYPNSNSFSRAFKHHEKQTPLGFRIKSGKPISL
jgi:AraC-like DNA-binding protein